MYSYSFAPLRSVKNVTSMKDIIIRGTHPDERVQSIRKQACCYAPDHSQRFGTKYEALPKNLDLFCFSHIRWDNIVQRPQQLMKRWALTRRVFFVEQPVVKSGPDSLQISKKENGVRLITPHLSPRAD